MCDLLCSLKSSCHCEHLSKIGLSRVAKHEACGLHEDCVWNNWNNFLFLCRCVIHHQATVDELTVGEKKRKNCKTLVFSLKKNVEETVMFIKHIAAKLVRLLTGNKSCMLAGKYLRLQKVS